ncbi:DL-endopeptidase inhibitor IseA family protein [Brevibacillus dissolubilis]|uniref:DL-endopeptidase inhibitor IseA family protein n=1 Tax=Brevibacillus dissolubilis TaxID=1844116 RepID=UPI0011168FFD|nr:DL-endopeptidase inhibitor IseA family protein [Brevibacillus dissolubilis]
MKPLKKMSVLACTLFLLAGCGPQQDQTTTTVPAKQSETPAAQPQQKPAEQTPATDTAQQTKPQKEEAVLDEKSVVKLVADASGRYWSVVAGGEGGGIELVKIDGQDYRYMGSNLDTMPELKDYLGEVYTQRMVERIIKDLNIKEYQGRLVQPNADGGSILQWENAQASLAEDKGNERLYELKVPYGEGADIQFDVDLIPVKKEANAWKVDKKPGSKE